LIIARVIIDKKQIQDGSNTNINTHNRTASASSTSSFGIGVGNRVGSDKRNGRHVTPTVSYILSAGLYVDLRIFELVATLYGVKGQDIWLNTLVFSSAVSSPLPSCLVSNIRCHLHSSWRKPSLSRIGSLAVP
jgi:hypothetical protein